MKDLSPIPIPAHQQWREFRIRRIPVIFFSLALFAVIFVWRGHIAGPYLVGEVEVVSSHVISTQPGLLSEVYVDRLEKVSKGQAIAKILPTDPDVLKANLVSLEVDLKMLRARMALDQTRNEFDYEKLRLDWLNKKVELATAEVNFQFEENEFQRVTKLWEEKIESQSVYEMTKAVRDARAKEVSEKTYIIAELKKRVDELQKWNSDQSTSDDPWVQAIAAQEAKLLMVEGPITLHASIDGFVSDVLYRAGDRVMSGQPIVSISALQSARVLGFVRQPLTVVPKIGDQVSIRTRGMPRRSAVGTVTQVGSELRQLSAPVALRGYDLSQERGLPFLVSLPAELSVFPGEIVDLSFKN
ncbi:MAG: HlyD family efflux transporter periplasmic adaptor subunit [Verrucomicrobia bacterium]|nr:HlyD family efflux transporter periplasmic adaptor subunit [Verrucomicrobiota bacterium]